MRRHGNELAVSTFFALLVAGLGCSDGSPACKGEACAGQRESENPSLGTDGGSQGRCDAASLPSEDPCGISDAAGVFVSSQLGSVSGSGTMKSPLKTIAAGIEAAKRDGKRVYVCAETYPEALQIESGVSVFGYFACSGGAWQVGGGRARLEAPSSPAARADRIARPTRVESLELVAPHAKAPGESSIGLIAVDATALELVNARVLAGNARAGAPGVAGASLTVSGTLVGQPSIPVLRDTLVPQSGRAGGAITCSANGSVLASHLQGGAGGSGGAGGVYRADVHVEGVFNTVVIAPESGNAASATTAAGGSRDTLARDGANGADGTAGADGAAGGTLGSFDADGYGPADGGDGRDGAPGIGGGGGAGRAMPQALRASALAGYAHGTPYAGAPGAGGGAGGCAGLGGTRGLGGGASVAIVAIRSPFRIVSSALQAGDGGAGGAGGPGSAGTAGSSGGSGGNGSVDDGARGGKGGSGGRGGNGGSGSGGPSIGIAHTGGVPLVLSTSVFPGRGGTGATTPPSPGGVANAMHPY